MFGKGVGALQNVIADRQRGVNDLVAPFRRTRSASGELPY
jgi:hypothetical protein